MMNDKKKRLMAKVIVCVIIGTMVLTSVFGALALWV